MFCLEEICENIANYGTGNHNKLTQYGKVYYLKLKLKFTLLKWLSDQNSVLIDLGMIFGRILWITRLDTYLLIVCEKKTLGTKTSYK